jgi:SPP1 family predicted phage head-tail adaptor
MASSTPRAGELRERITIRRQVNIKNTATGGLTRSWQTVATVAAKIVPLNGRESVVAHVLSGISVFEIVIRFRTGIEASDQVLWNGRELNITAPPEDRMGLRRHLWITASTQAPQGA